MFKNLLIADILSNPVILAFILSTIRAIGGYITELIASYAKKQPLERFKLTKYGETLAIYETFLVALTQIPNMPLYLAVIMAVVVDIVRKIQKPSQIHQLS